MILDDDEDLVRDTGVSFGQLDVFHKFSIIVVFFVFLVRIQYFVSKYLAQIERDYCWDLSDWHFYLVFLFLAGFYAVSLLGYLLRRRFGYRLAWFMVFIDFIIAFGNVFVGVPLFAGLGLVVLAWEVVCVFMSRRFFPSADRLDKAIVMAAALIVVLYLASGQWIRYQPSPGELQAILTAEAIEKDDVTICDGLIGGYRLECIRGFAEHKKDPKLCELLENSSYHADNCYLEIADETKNAELCKNIKGEYTLDNCYLRIAREINDRGLCEQITSEYYRGLCYDFSKG